MKLRKSMTESRRRMASRMSKFSRDVQSSGVLLLLVGYILIVTSPPIMHILGIPFMVTGAALLMLGLSLNDWKLYEPKQEKEVK